MRESANVNCTHGRYGAKITNHDRSYGDEGVINRHGFVDVTGLERYLETATSHPEAHRIHVNVVWFCGAILGL